MIQFLRLLNDTDKATSLLVACARLRRGDVDEHRFEVAPESFDAIPGKPFSYWVSEAVHRAFEQLPPFEGEGRTVKIGMKTGDDFRFLRLWWEVQEAQGTFRPYAKGGATDAFYADIHAMVNWKHAGAEVKQFVSQRMHQMFGNENYEFWISNEAFYGLPGITWSLRAERFSPRVLPTQSIFSVRGYAAFLPEGVELASLALMNSAAFDYVFKSALGRFGYPEFIVGTLQKLPWRIADGSDAVRLATVSRRAWSLKRTLDTIHETSHSFMLPAFLRIRLDDYVPTAIEAELIQIQAEIDDIAFDLYRFSEADRQAVLVQNGAQEVSENEEEDESDAEVPPVDALLSWAVGVAFGRFDWRLATGERQAPPEPEPFAPLPSKSPGMLPDGAESFRLHEVILVDDQGHPHDLTRLVEESLARVDAHVPEDVRTWLKREFFAFHLRQYSKSRRKAPIYWPLATTSSSYTLWLYYPGLTSQTLYTAINDFIDPKLKQVGGDLSALRNKGAARSRNDEGQFESLQAFELELIELRDTLLKLAPTYKPNHDDGVQISAAPLWPLFRHKAWQKVLKDTWAKLEKGDYDWAHLAMNYWPERVRDWCKSDKSLAIAHGLEDLYVDSKVAPKKTRGRKKGE
jgi:hypothetical protein